MAESNSIKRSQPAKIRKIAAKSSVRLGVIGLGNIGRLHIQNIQSGAIGRCELAAVCSTVPAELAHYPGVPAFAESRDLIRSGLVDAVLIATPHYSHTAIGIDALGRGLHVLVEKPISVHKADAERLIAAHTDESQVFAAMFNQRTSPLFIRIKQLIEAGELGVIRRTNWITTDWFRPEIYYASGGWRATWRGEGGGVLLNQCPHNLDLFQWLCGMPERIRATCHLGKYHNIEVEDEVTAYLEYPGGATGVFIASTGEAPGTNRLEIAGDRGKIVAENGRLLFTRNEVPAAEFSRTTRDCFGAPPVWHVEIPVAGPGEQHAGILKNFISAILDGEPLIAPAEEGLNSVELANAMLYSSLTGKTVPLPLDARAYERKLNQLIRDSKFVKKVDASAKTDIAKSFQ
jgi:predicted dehydrogenase